MRKIKQQHRHHGRRRKENDRSHQARNVLADDQHFSAHGAQKVIVQTAVDHLTAKQVHEDPGRTEEDERSQNQNVVNDRVDEAVIVEISPLVSRWREQREKRERKERRERNQIDQYRATAEKVFLDLEAKDGADLAEPKSPTRRHRFGCGLSCLNRRTHSVNSYALPPVVPIRYW